MMRKTFVLLILTAPLLATGANAAEGERVFVGAFQDWEVFHQGTGRDKICYMASVPKKKQGDYDKRGDVQFFVTHLPGVEVRDEVSVTAGYTFKKGSEVEAQIGKESFRLFTEGDAAWMLDRKSEQEMVQAMKKGSTMVVRGISSRDTKTTDNYSLQGFTAAHNEIDKLCKE